MPAKPVVLSGIQPSGGLHLGNYLGALREWVALQDSHDAYYCVVDWHAITVPYEPALLRARTIEAAAELLACGLDEERCTLFVQSAVKEHAELAWLLTTITPLGQTERMTQFKERAEQFREHLNLGLLSYPVLQSADILIYRADAVPVGEDQRQHVELCREIAKRFNHTFSPQRPIFPLPKPLIGKGARIMSLSDPTKKMSKSDPDPDSRIELEEPEQEVRRKLSRAVTDPARVRRQDPGSPDRCNVGGLHKILSSAEDNRWVWEGCTTAGIGCLECKSRLADNVVAFLRPIQERKRALDAEPARVEKVLERGAGRARARARETMLRVREVTGLGEVPGAERPQ